MTNSRSATGGGRVVVVAGSVVTRTVVGGPPGGRWAVVGSGLRRGRRRLAAFGRGRARRGSSWSLQIYSPERSCSRGIAAPSTAIATINAATMTFARRRPAGKAVPCVTHRRSRHGPDRVRRDTGVAARAVARLRPASRRCSWRNRGGRPASSRRRWRGGGCVVTGGGGGCVVGATVGGGRVVVVVVVLVAVGRGRRRARHGRRGSRPMAWQPAWTWSRG